MLSGGLIICLLIFALVLKVQMISVEKQIGLLNESLSNESTAKVAEVNRLKEDLEKISKDEELFKQFESYIEGKEKVNAELVQKITSVLPDGIYIQELNLSETGYEIKAIAKSQDYIAEFQQNIRNLNLSKDIYIPEITEADGYYNFVLSMKN